jgi:hypothetical protein
MAGILTHEQQLAFGVHTRGWRLVEIAREIPCCRVASHEATSAAAFRPEYPPRLGRLGHAQVVPADLM